MELPDEISYPITPYVYKMVKHVENLAEFAASVCMTILQTIAIGVGILTTAYFLSKNLVMYKDPKKVFLRIKSKCKLFSSHFTIVASITVFKIC